MASAVILKFQSLLKESGALFRPYEHAPLLLPINAAMLVVSKMDDDLLVIAGGDFWFSINLRFERESGWSCEKLPHETADSYAKRSLLIATKKMCDVVKNSLTDSIFVDLVVKDAITGESLREM